MLVIITPAQPTEPTFGQLSQSECVAVMKLLRSALVAWLLTVPRTGFAQQPTAASESTQTSRKPALDASLQSPMLTTPNLPSWIAMTPTTFGIFTFVTPEARGEFVSVNVPIGDLTMRAARAIGSLERRRAERAAREEVGRAVEALQVAMPNQPAASKR